MRRVDRRLAEHVEQLGSKPKFWFQNRQLLFKADDRGTGEDWAEVVTSELCERLGLPHVHYELAIECDGAKELRPGVVCRNMASPPRTLVLGNQLLVEMDPKYPSSQRTKVRQHTIDAVCDALSLLDPAPFPENSRQPAAVQTALGTFIGYVMLDAWVANQDRHHENWGAIWDGPGHDRLWLAPTFDHGASLARNLSDEERLDRLTTQDAGRSVQKFVTRGRSAFFRSPDDTHPLQLLDAFADFARRDVLAAHSWIERLKNIEQESIASAVRSIPETRMSSVTRRFTLRLLELNQIRLLACFERLQ
jgi:hypothetical protein